MKTKFNGILTLLLALLVQITFAQEKTISGTVADQSGPLPGVNILKKGTNQGVNTDFDGKYTIKAKTGDVLVFSFVGMKTVEKTVGASNTINVAMVNDDVLDEVVVTAFGNKRQAKSLGYATTKVSSKELTEVANSNPLESLSGKIAGVDISSPAQPGASTKIIFRGFSSITGSNRPLYVVDGSPILDRSSSSVGSTSSFDAGSGVNDIDPNSIESINFLKGAAAASLYGSRGSNGVVIITTKRGRDKLKVSIDSSVDFSQLSRVVHVQDSFGTGWSAKSYSNVVGEGSMAASNENGSWGPKFNGQIRPWSRIVDNQQLIKPYVFLKDNIREFYDIGNSFNNSINISGGNDKIDASLTYSRFDIDGIIPTDRDSYLKNNIGVNAGFGSDKFKIRVSGNYSNKEQKAVPTGQGDDAGFGKSLVQEMLQIPNNLSIVDMRDRSLVFNKPSYFYTPYAANPYETLENNNVAIAKDRFFGNVNLKYQLMSNLSATLQMATDIDNEAVKRWGAIVEYDPGSPQDNAAANGVVGAVNESKYTSKEFDTYLNINYDTELNDNLTLGALAGLNYNQRKGNSLAVTVKDLDLPNYYELSNSASTPTVEQSNYLRRVIGVYGQIELGYLDRYFLTLTARNDFSSTLPSNNNSYFYPSATLAAIVLDDGNQFIKLRGSWARIGNDTNQYEVFSTAGQAVNAAYFGEISYPFGNVNSYEIFGRIENQNLKPEITDEIELGLEGRFFMNRIGVDLSLYQRKTKDLIVQLPVARSTGYSNITGNFVDLTNKGVELALSLTPVKVNNFTWDLNYTFTKNLSNVDKVKNDDHKISIYSAYNISFYAEEGKPLGTFYGPAPAKTDDGKYIANANTGYYTYDGDEQELGNSQRDFVMGLKNTFTYKDFKLGMSLDWKQGGEMYSYTKRLSYFVGNGQETTYNDRNPWIIPNSVVSDGKGGYVENTTPVAFEDVTAFYNASQNEAIEGDHIISKTFVRFRDLSLSYKLPSRFFNVKNSLESITFSLYGKNLALWTPGGNTYVDPETTSYGRGIRSEFGEFATNPSQRSYGASVKLTF
ncbi:SusC/RagA family TonB-linked outer membrane protein [Tenacibaculum sp. UWU-22]|uniref:SusC/RagA family TonB-linked outer membrane protein n=1 Tax=Tenacibaculum sp. UWU-22 TaxID=3234187 RepID=UPI0034DABDE7